MKGSLSSSVFICFLRMHSSIRIFSVVSFMGCMSLTSTRTLRIRSLTCASISLSDSIVSYIASKSSLLFSMSCVSVAVCFFASDRILFRKTSTGLSKAKAQVIPQRITVEAADMYR